MKILYLITGLRLGGAERQLLLLATNMQRAGHHVLVVSMESGGVMVNEFLRYGIEVKELDVKGLESLPVAYHRLKKIVQNFSPTIIHSHMIHANVFAAVFKLFNSKYKLVCTAHNIKEGNRVSMAGYYFASSLADRTTNVSREAFDHYVHKGYFKPKKSSFIPNAIDTGAFDPAKFDKMAIRQHLGIPEIAFVFFSAGRLHHQKNYQMLLKAYAIVNKEVKNVFLFIAGEGPEATSLNKLCADLGLDANRIFLGRRDDIAALMRMSACFVLSSVFEGFGLVVAEAMAMETPVISTDCGGVKEIMGGLGTLVKVNDIDGLSKAMIASTHGNKKQPAGKLRSHIKNNYDIPVVIEKWINLYNNLC